MFHPKLRIVIVGLVLVAISGCSSTTTIHLNALYLDDHEAEGVKRKLEDEGYDIELNRNAFPSSISSSGLIYSPLLRDISAVNKVESSLAELGYKMGARSQLVSSNHWYKENSIGLYLLPKNLQSLDENARRLAATYTARNCGEKMKLELQPDGKFRYDFSKQESLTGDWAISSYPYIVLENDDPYVSFYYEVKESTVTELGRQILLTQLEPLTTTDDIPHCQLFNEKPQ